MQVSFEDACYALGVTMEGTTEEILARAHSAFRRASCLCHEDRMVHASDDEKETARKMWAMASAALAKIEQTLRDLVPRAPEPSAPRVTLGSKKVACVIRLRLEEADLEAADQERAFTCAYEDACYDCKRTGRAFVAGRVCPECGGEECGWETEAAAAGIKIVCPVCVGTGLYLSDAPCSVCKGKQKVRRETTLRVPAHRAMQDQQLFNFDLQRPTFYSAGRIRIVLKLPEPSTP